MLNKTKATFRENSNQDGKYASEIGWFLVLNNSADGTHNYIIICYPYHMIHFYLWRLKALYLRKAVDKLVQVMACNLTATRLYLNQCWLIIKVFRDNCLRAILQDLFTDSFRNICSEITHLELLTHWDRDEMNNIWQTKFSNNFFQWKCLNFD